MTYKIVSVHLDASARCAARVELAARVAMQHGARLVGIAPTGVPDIVVSLNAAVPEAIECISPPAGHLRRQAEAAVEAFEHRCREFGSLSWSAVVVVDEATDAVIRHGRCSDLVVVGQTDVDAPTEGAALDLPQQVLLHAGPPVLVVPYAGSFPGLGRRVLVAWKDTREAARALRDALPILRGAERVLLVEVGAVQPMPDARNTLDAAGAWLRAHGVAFDAHREIEIGDVGEQLLSRASDFGATLIVSGGYGHSRLREWVMGGVTRHLLEHMTVPTLLAH